MLKINLLLGLFMLIGLSVMGQESKNPFDLKYKKAEVATKVINISPDSQRIAIDEDSFSVKAVTSQISASGTYEINDTNQSKADTYLADNPFNIIRVPINESKSINPSAEVIEPTVATIQEEDIEDSGFMFWVLLGILLVFSSIFGAAKGKISQVSSSFMNENFLRQTHRSNQGNFSFLYVLLYVLALLNIAIFTYLLSNYFSWERPNSMLLLLKMAGIVGVLFSAKHLLLSLVGYIFPIQKELSLYSFTIMVFGIILGLLLLPINIVIAYAPYAVGQVVVYLSLGAIIALYVFRMIRGLSIGSKYLVLHKFHFFIYLCTVEILPVIVLLKILDNYTGISFF